VKKCNGSGVGWLYCKHLGGQPHLPIPVLDRSTPKKMDRAALISRRLTVRAAYRTTEYITLPGFEKNQIFATAFRSHTGPYSD